MPNKNEHDTERFLRVQAQAYRMRNNQQMARNFELCADDVKRLHAELAALKEAFAPLVLACEEADNSEELCENVEGQLICNARAALDALAAKVGEE